MRCVHSPIGYLGILGLHGVSEVYGVSEGICRATYSQRDECAMASASAFCWLNMPFLRRLLHAESMRQPMRVGFEENLRSPSRPINGCSLRTVIRDESCMRRQLLLPAQGSDSSTVSVRACVRKAVMYGCKSSKAVSSPVSGGRSQAREVG